MKNVGSKDLKLSYDFACVSTMVLIDSNEKNESVEKAMGRLLGTNIWEYPEDRIFSSGYVIHTLEASIWSIMNTTSYKEAVLQAVNLGDDTDTTGCVTGALAGLYYGYDSIPKEWIESIDQIDYIEDMISDMNTKKTIKLF
jgi:ADP-ribosylglycohydrolase